MVSSDFLKSHALFGGLTDIELEKIKEYFKEEEFDKEQVIIEEGKSGDSLYFITYGSVEILKRCNDDDRTYGKRIASLKTGDTFGEMELIDIQARAATVRTLESTGVLSLSNMALYKIQKWNLFTYTMIIMNLARELSRRLRKMDALVAATLDG